MVKNVKLKKMLKSSVFPVLSRINKILPKNDKYILLYSPNMGIEHNLRPVLDYLLENGYDKKYKIICGVNNKHYFENDYRVKNTTPLKSFVYYMFTKHVFYTTGQIPIKPSKKQIVIQLDHGTAGIKTIGYLSNINNGDEFFFTYYTAPSEAYIPILKKEFLCEDKNIVLNGEPVTDIFYQPTQKYNLGSFDKIGLWAPTFRQSNYLGYDDSTESLLPMFSLDEYDELNEKLKSKNIKLIVKIHSVQNLNDHDINLNYSNIEILSDAEFKNKGYKLYNLLKQMDFLIGDYSSVYLQYLLLNKPIGFVIPDIEEYEKKRGFVFENIQEYMPGHKIKNKKQLYDFIDDIHNNLDIYNEERLRVCNIIHKYQDGNNCKRALEFSEIYL